MRVLYVFQICMCISSANSWFDIILLLTAPPTNLFGVVKVPDRACLLALDVCYQQIHKQLKQVHVDIHHTLDFSQY